MALVILGLVPFTLLGMVVEFSFYGGAASNSSEAYAKANSTVLEALMAIRIGEAIAAVAAVAVR